MKEKKNIDSIFNEGFKNFEATPSPRVWENIQTQLKKEKDRKVIPLWIKVGGVAALIAVLFSVGNWIYNPSDIETPSITEENVIKTEKEINGNNSEFVENNSEIENEINSNKTQVASEESTLQNESGQDLDVSDKNSSEEKNQDKSSNKKLLNSSEKLNKTVIASSNSEKNISKEKANSQKDFIEKSNPKKDLKEGIATSKNTSEKINSDKNGTEAKENLFKRDKDLFDTKNEGIVANEKTVEDTAEKNAVKTETEVLQESQNKKSIFDAIAEEKEDLDSEKTKNQKPEHRWNVAPNVAPVYYSSLGNGSSIDPSFADNPQKGDVNMSYGVQVSYALSNRLSVRTGVNNVDFSYSTSGIEVGTGPVAVALRSVDYGSKQVVVTVADKGSFANAASSNGFGNITPKSTKGDTKLIQSLNYYEVPLELKYAVINNKVGVNVIGGLSTLFLGNNEISVKADNFNTVLGDANNLSTVSFSTNVGLGLDYKLSKKFTFNIEPMFKYQLNPYTDSSVNFKPYYLGVYSGLSFKF